MGVQFMFDETVPSDFDGKKVCTVEVCDNHSVPEVRIGPEGSAHLGHIAHFTDWKQFVEFREAVENLYERLRRVYE